MKTRLSVLAAAACIVLAGAPALADWKIKVTEHPDGGYVSSLTLKASDEGVGRKNRFFADDIIIGTYATRQEARAAAELKRRELEGGKPAKVVNGDPIVPEWGNQ